MTPERNRRDGLQGLGRARPAAAGLTLVELLVATCVVTAVLGAAWPWLWNTGQAARAAAARAQAGTSAAFALRCIRDDLGVATRVLVPADGRTPDAALYVRHEHAGASPETVSVVWDPARKVVWRKAPGTYLADHVETFSVRYFRADGSRLLSGDFALGDWAASVARVSVTLSTRVGAGTATATLDLVPGPA